MSLARSWIRRGLTVVAALVFLAVGGIGFQRWRIRPRPGHMFDEARIAKRASVNPPDEDYFHGMDGGIDLSLEEIQGTEYLDGVERGKRPAVGLAGP